MSEQPHFDISAAVVRQLGEELVTDEFTAIIELAKNAYDADATYANLVVDTNHVLTSHESLFAGTEGYISIEDDGIGMTLREIEEGWLTISFSKKRAFKQQGGRTPKGRTPLGEKGLGRLSTQRLGNQLELLTLDRETGETYHVAFDWAEFTEDKRLTAVPIRFHIIDNGGRKKGTKLLISKLRDKSVWSGENRKELGRRISQLILPFGEIRPFRVYITVDGQSLEIEKIADQVRDAAMARFRFDYSKGLLNVNGKLRLSRFRGLGVESNDDYQRFLAEDHGRDFFTYLTSADNRWTISAPQFIESGNWFIAFSDTRELDRLGRVVYTPDGIVADPGPFHAEIDEFTLRGTNLEGLSSVFDNQADFNVYIKQHAGVRVFRNGFAIRPYGHDGNDWLKLGVGQTSGRSFYGLRPENVIGYVAITEDENQQLREKTDREGFIDSPYSANFFRLMDEAVEIVNKTYNNLRRAYNDYRKVRAEETAGYTTLRAPLQDMRGVSSEAEKLQQQVIGLERRLDQITHTVRTVTDRVEREPLFASQQENEFTPLLKEVYAILADANGLVRELNAHLLKAKSLSGAADYLEPQIVALQTQLEDFSELAALGLTAEALSHEIYTIADRLAAQSKVVTDIMKKRALQHHELVTYTQYVMSAALALRKQLSHLAPSLRYMREQKETISILSFLEEMKDFYMLRFQEAGIQFVLGEPSDNFNVQMNRGRLTQIVDNIILNSEYWLNEAIRASKVTKPTITVRAKRPYVMIEDNGPGVDPSVERTLFQPFVTTKPRGQGRGLGLFIVQQLLDSIGGKITLLTDRNEQGRRYIFQIDLGGSVRE